MNKYDAECLAYCAIKTDRWSLVSLRKTNGLWTTQIHTDGSWNEAAAISHSSCAVRFMDTWRKTTSCWFAGSFPYV